MSAILRSVRFGLRIAAILALAVGIPTALGLGLGRLGAVGGVGLSLLGLLWWWLWLPRSAHAAFEAAKYRLAARRYRVLALLAASGTRERAARLSRAGCYIAAGALASAEQILASVDGATLEPSARAVWLNNRACAMLASEADPHGALALIDEASSLRPDVPSVQHTRAMALLAVDRVDEAIGVLDGMRAGGELSTRLEAERCRELARAWARKGEDAYAEDYRVRAATLAR